MLDMVDLYTPRGLLYIQHIQPGARLKGLFFPKTIATTSADRCLVELLARDRHFHLAAHSLGSRLFACFPLTALWLGVLISPGPLAF